MFGLLLLVVIGAICVVPFLAIYFLFMPDKSKKSDVRGFTAEEIEEMRADIVARTIKH